ncbi:MAG: site-2 protease family protein [Methanophagales archaeon]|nr:site-2 protease family protein [Methanophagales archaeon]MCW3138408.1 site-2 protease family protein [Methanophagales archaeon]
MKIRTSSTELKHLLIAWIAISFAFTVLIKRWMILNLSWANVFILSTITVGSAFIFHELAHKFVAQSYGSWSEFRMEPFMLFIAILLPFFLPFIFAAPGAVMIFNPYLTREESGKIALAGPMMNVALAMMFLPLFYFSHGLFRYVGYFGMFINAWLALFNMIPISVLDGKKVLAWDRRIYTFALLIALSVLILNELVVV